MHTQPDQHSSAPTSQASGIVDQLSSSRFSVSRAVGGPRGVIESLLPSLVFLVVFTISRQLMVTIVACAVVSVACFVARLIQRQKVTSVLIGFLLAALCLLAAGLSKDARNFYVPGFFINGAWALVLLLSVVMRYPAVGVVCELAVGIPARQWKPFLRSHRSFRRASYGATWLWIILFALRLVLEIPLWVIGEVTWLGTVRLVTGIPLFVIVVWGTWLLVGSEVSTFIAARTRDHHEDQHDRSDRGHSAPSASLSS